MSWKIKRVIRTDVEFGWPKQKGYEVEIETTFEDGTTDTHIEILPTEEVILRKFLEDQYTQAVVDGVWELIENYGQQKYSEGTYSVDVD